MRLLLDTHILLWWLYDPARLRRSVVAAIATPENDVFVSAAVAWELSIKQALGRLTFPLDDYRAILDQGGFAPLPIDAGHAIAAGQLRRLHGDPFDRMMIAQAILERLTLVTEDPQILRYDVPVLTA